MSVPIAASNFARRGKQLSRRGIEDVRRRERVAVAEVNSAVHLENDPAASRAPEQVDAGEIGSDRRYGGERGICCLGCDRGRAAACADGDVRSPLSPRRLSLDASDDHAACDDDANITTRGRDEFLDERSLSPEPGATTETTKRLVDVRLRFAELDVPAPTSKARLDNDRSAKRRKLPFADVRGARVCDSEACEADRRFEFVVCREERPSPVQDVDAVSREPPKRAEPWLDPVQGWPDVEPSEDGVAGRDRAWKLAGAYPGRVNTEAKKRLE